MQEIQKLSRQVAALQPYRIDNGFLFASLQYLLTDAHLAILLQNENSECRQDFLLKVRPLAELLPYHLLKEMERPLISLAKGMKRQEPGLLLFFAQKKKERQRAKIFPLLVALITLILCLAMFWYGRR